MDVNANDVALELRKLLEHNERFDPGVVKGDGQIATLDIFSKADHIFQCTVEWMD